MSTVFITRHPRRAVICSNCGTENRPGRKFCAECAAPLAVVCPSCGAANEPGEKFCGECAAPLTDTAGVASPGPTSWPVTLTAAPVAERRLVTVLFADIFGFTPFAEERDAEEVRDTLSRYFELCADVIGRYGGTIEKYIGDAVRYPHVLRSCPGHGRNERWRPLQVVSVRFMAVWPDVR